MSKHSLATTSIGADLRAVRRARGMTLEKTAEALGRSVGWLSQVERDISQPGVSDLKALADLYGVSISLFFGQNEALPGEEGRIVRRVTRRKIGDESTGLIEELLSPDLTDDFEVIHSTFTPGTSGDTLQRKTQEIAYLISGKLDIWIDDTPFTVEAGDSFRVRGNRFRWANPYDISAKAVWVIAPPVY